MADQVTAIIADLTRYTEGEVIGLTLEIDANLREDTPVDTGWAAANWVPTIGQPAPPVPALGGKASTADVAEAIRRNAESRAAISTYTLDKGSTFVSNGVPYIRPLNEGHSAQAPAAFVEACIVRAVAARGGA